MDVTTVALGRDYTILGAAGSFQEVITPMIGKCLWDEYPDAPPIYGPVYEEAWEVGWCYRTIEYRGDLLRASTAGWRPPAIRGKARWPAIVWR